MDPFLRLYLIKQKKTFNKIISNYEKPLALYVFTGKKHFANKMIANYSFGGGTINDTTVHFANHNLPFGGVGESGVGAYHGKQTFDVFCHKKGVTKRYNWLDHPCEIRSLQRQIKNIKNIYEILFITQL